MKPVVQQLTEDNLVIKNYVIVPSSKRFATHNLYEIGEDLCQEMADKEDRGLRYSLNSRYTYSCEGFSAHHNGIQYGTAKAAVQRAIYEHFGDLRYLKIIKLQDDEKDNSVSEEALDKI
jgi:hypothetical protein